MDKPSLYFSATLALLLTWGTALSLTSFSLRAAIHLLAGAILSTAIIYLLLRLIIAITHRPIFGTRRIYYFPRGTMLIVSAIGAALFGLIYRLSDHSPMTPFHLRTYLIGYILAVLVLMGYFFSLSRRK